MNPTLRQMRAFVALAKTGNFTSAAQVMHVTQSALSGLIKELEQTLGARVVDRSTRRITLTDIGRELYPLFSQMIDDLDGALANVADHTQLRKGVVRIAAPQLMCCTLVPEAMAAYRAQQPDIDVRVADSAVENVIARVLSGESDIGIGPEREPTPQLQAQELFELPFALVFPEGHPLELLPRVTWQDLARYPFIALQGQFTERLLADMHALPRAFPVEVPLKPANEVTFMTTALAMVSAGLGVTVCLPYAEPLVSLYKLRMRPLEEPVLTRRFFVYTRAGRSLSPAAESFIDFLFPYVAGKRGQG
ncbi:LysR family transcriptional regulator [Massilia sp. Dwa41.01b]|uniref:LysR family transcriptional regulator n=1 Tax=unclassified Massilia TaxID=2609279 RepID=UPI001600753D|nr:MULTISPECIES: LysR family transcriptional regulator [unclassified Massilia]QNA89764.1 LysR family transcriptional regulator [Massilia sp. Dwa41.01b]QNB00658.1 LysR family transcriptional regulator [Massilia sp. Se16.2.3]